MNLFSSIKDKYLSPNSKYRSAFVAEANDDRVIDGLRAIAVLMVILFHSFYGAAFVLKDAARIKEFFRSIPEELGFLFTTEKAVDIFFMISAFLLGKSLMIEYTRYNSIDLKRFFTRRLFRICPLFYIAIILFFPVNVSLSLKNLIYNLLFIDNFWGKMIVPTGWSLCIEMQFYLILPFLISWLLRRQNPKSCLLAIVAMATLIQALVCFLMPVLYETPFIGYISGQVDPNIYMVNYYYPTHTRFGPLIVGLLWAYLYWKKDEDKFLAWLRQHRVARYGLGLLSLAAVVCCSYYPPYNPYGVLNRSFTAELNFWAMILHRNLYSLGVLGLLVLIHCLQSEDGPWRVIRRGLSMRFWRPFSQSIFPMYLFQFPMIAIAGIVVFGTTNMKQVRMLSLSEVFLIFVLASFLSLLLGIFLHVRVEKPFIAMGDRLVKRGKQSL